MAAKSPVACTTRDLPGQDTSWDCPLCPILLAQKVNVIIITTSFVKLFRRRKKKHMHTQIHRGSAVKLYTEEAYAVSQHFMNKGCWFRRLVPTENHRHNREGQPPSTENPFPLLASFLSLGGLFLGKFLALSLKVPNFRVIVTKY
ncbi:hypothetical protein A4A49_27023 [Nicotiana attenuata]|uniref:Uncharacterized protein n=1 Tax=Nicotiana attenuata TaxID=49451 RepID=A0A1J6IAQ9_NICAT|nr:hypothetical protein A4A49_27023 [Nicotiana attenuata]